LPLSADFSAICSASSNSCISISLSLYIVLVLCLTFLRARFTRVVICIYFFDVCQCVFCFLRVRGRSPCDKLSLSAERVRQGRESGLAWQAL
jgi:hypothetical protein